MTIIPRKLRKYLQVLVPAIIVGGVTMYFLSAFLPNLQTTRRTLDDARASVLALQRQQNSIDQLRSQLSDIEQNELIVENNAWTFVAEENFFTFWENLAQEFSLKLVGPDIADAVPAKTLVSRATKVTLKGSLANLLESLTQIQSHEPLLAISKMTLAPDTTTTSSLTIELNTIWK